MACIMTAGIVTANITIIAYTIMASIVKAYAVMARIVNTASRSPMVAMGSAMTDRVATLWGQKDSRGAHARVCKGSQQ